MEAFILICDFAEEIGGKLYIMGGGWSRLTRTKPVADISVAARLMIPWDQTNQKHQLTLRLVDSDGQTVDFGTGPTQIMGEFEVGRPPGLQHGTPLAMPLAFRFEDLPLQPGRYRWDFSVDDAILATAAFDVSD